MEDFEMNNEYMSIISNIIANPGKKYEVPKKIEEKLCSFSNESIARNTDTKKFPRIQNTRAKVISRLRGRKMIPRVPFYIDKGNGERKLQISSIREEFTMKEEGNGKKENQKEEHNLEEQTITEEYKGLKEINYFNQWFAANNFDILKFNETYDKITIDEDESEYSPEDIRIEICDVDFTNLKNMWKYINDIQETGSWTCHNNLVRTIQNFFRQYNVDVFREIMKRPWLEAKKNVLKYFFITKKLLIKMQNGTKEKELRQELEDFKSEGITIINPENRTTRDLKRFREIRNMPNYKNSYEEIYKKLSELC
jgi:hypothetical protein